MRVRSERAQKAEITGARRAESPRRSRCTTDAQRTGENTQERKASWASLRGFAGREATDERRVEALGSGDAVRPEDRPFRSALSARAVEHCLQRGDHDGGPPAARIDESRSGPWRTRAHRHLPRSVYGRNTTFPSSTASRIASTCARACSDGAARIVAASSR